MEEVNKSCKGTAQFCHLNLCYFLQAMGRMLLEFTIQSEIILIFYSVYIYSTAGRTGLYLNIIKVFPS